MTIVTWSHKSSSSGELTVVKWRIVLKTVGGKILMHPEKHTIDALGADAWVSEQGYGRREEMLMRALLKVGTDGLPPGDEAAGRLGGDLVIDLGLLS